MGSSSNVVVASSNSRFMIISTQNTFHRVSPFLVNKLIQSTIGEVQNIKKLRSGDLLLQTSEKQALLISKLTKLGDFPVQTALHKTLNFSRGVISEPDLIDLSDGDLVTEFSDQQVCSARHINIRRDGQLIPTKHIVLTFQTPVLPKSIKAGYQICRVRPYIPNPLRCFKCQRYGHSQQACRSKMIMCAKCAEPGHEINNCHSDTMNNKTKISTTSSLKAFKVNAKQRTKKKALLNRPLVAEDFLKTYTSSSEFSDMELDPSTISKNQSGGEKKKKPPDKS
ncbi:uncharacterized protein LOC129962131 [Argiope bruennichi]|uniref:uncharacterized protein LOC129962131 n=1 Tax=Argiope bruennichi TaxID=94029 RepID=UPI0024943123|nr:uncharacterized protein LOC129962131 [Argiope bruennichi]